MEKELLTLVLSGTTGILGYALREWQNHFRPFIKTVSFEGDYFFGSSVVDLKKEICDKLVTAFYLNKLDYKSSLEDIQTAKNRAKSIRQNAPTIIKIIEELKLTIKRNDTDLVVFKQLQELFEVDDVDYFIGSLLLKGKVKISNSNQNKTSTVELTESANNNGCFVLSFDGELFGIGVNFNEDNLYKEIFRPLVKIIMAFDRECILDFINSLKLNLNEELEIANNVFDHLDKLINESSRWETELYIANLKKTPILLGNRAIMHVQDKTGAEFHEACILALHENDNDGNIIKRKSKIPIIIPDGEHISCCFFTEKTQNEMDRGSDFRNAFVHGEAKAWLELTIDGVGLIKRKKLKTKKEIFKEL